MTELWEINVRVCSGYLCDITLLEGQEFNQRRLLRQEPHFTGSTCTPHTCTESSKKVTVVGLWPWSPSAALRAGQVQPSKGINSASEMVQTCASLLQESRVVAKLWASKGDTREVEAGGAGSKAAPSAKGDSWGHLPPLWSSGRNRRKDAHSCNTPAPGSWVPYGLKMLPATLHTCCPGCHKK